MPKQQFSFKNKSKSPQFHSLLKSKSKSPCLHTQSSKNLELKPQNQENSKYNNILFSYQTSIIITEFACLKDNLDIYQWRSNTQYPIIKANCINSNKMAQTLFLKSKINTKRNHDHNSNNQQILLQIRTQYVEKLSSFIKLTFSQYIYALKQSLIGYQRLLAIFGPFQIDKNMIAVNQKGRVCVWLNTKYQQNIKWNLSYQENDKQKIQKIMTTDIKNIFLALGHDIPQSKQLFVYLKDVYTFIEIYKVIDYYISIKKIITSKNIRILKTKRTQSPLNNCRMLNKTKFVPGKFFNTIDHNNSLPANNEQQFYKFNCSKKNNKLKVKKQQQNINFQAKTNQSLTNYSNQQSINLKNHNQSKFFEIKKIQKKQIVRPHFNNYQFNKNINDEQVVKIFNKSLKQPIEQKKGLQLYCRNINLSLVFETKFSNQE